MQNDKPTPDFFNKNVSEAYNERQQKLAPITENLHFLINLVLHDLPTDAKILCVGVGTGTEIISLAKLHPNWHFVGIDPSADMLDVCRKELEKNELSDRTELFHGYLSDFKHADKFDAVLCLLVTQFVKSTDERQKLFDLMASSLTPKGYLINAELSANVGSPQFLEQLDKWKAMQRLAGSTEDQVANILPTWKEHVSIVPPTSIEAFLNQSGFSTPVQFFQSLFIHAWFSQKS